MTFSMCFHDTDTKLTTANSVVLAVVCCLHRPHTHKFFKCLFTLCAHKFTGKKQTAQRFSIVCLITIIVLFYKFYYYIIFSLMLLIVFVWLMHKFLVCWLESQCYLCYVCNVSVGCFSVRPGCFLFSFFIFAPFIHSVQDCDYYTMALCICIQFIFGHDNFEIRIYKLCMLRCWLFAAARILYCLIFMCMCF